MTTKFSIQIDGSAEVSGSKKDIDTTAPLIHSYQFIKVTDGKQKLHKAFDLCELLICLLQTIIYHLTNFKLRTFLDSF